MAPFAEQPSPQRSTPYLCPHCGQQAAWMCENYCPPHVSGGMRGTPVQGVTVGGPSGAVPPVGSHGVGHAQAVRNRQGEASGGGDCPSR